MREIKFRAWAKCAPKGEHSMTYWKLGTGLDNSNFFKHAISKEYGDGGVMQFTGLKDSKGKEIFESDLLSLFTKDLTTKFLYLVKYEDAKFVLYHANNDHGKWGDLHRAFDPDFKDYGFSIVGNIYENLELAQGN